MRSRILLLYQILTSLSDTSTGILLLAAPALTLRLMRLHPDPATLPYISYIGAFVFSVGLACLYGATVIDRPSKLEAVWLLTAITRASVAIFVAVKVATGILEPGWINVALSDGTLALIQAVGLLKGWPGDSRG